MIFYNHNDMYRIWNCLSRRGRMNPPKLPDPSLPKILLLSWILRPLLLRIWVVPVQHQIRPPQLSMMMTNRCLMHSAPQAQLVQCHNRQPSLWYETL